MGWDRRESLNVSDPPNWIRFLTRIEALTRKYCVGRDFFQVFRLGGGNYQLPPSIHDLRRDRTVGGLLLGHAVDGS